MKNNKNKLSKYLVASRMTTTYSKAKWYKKLMYKIKNKFRK